MEYLEDWVDRALSCFYKERDKTDTMPQKDKLSPLYYLDPIELLDDGKLKEDFEKFVNELGLNEEKKLELCDYPREKKIAMLNTQIGRYSEDCASLLSSLKKLNADFPEKVTEGLLEQLQDLVITLRTQSHSFISEFVSTGGVPVLSSLLATCHLRSGRDQLALFFLCAFRALLNSTNGRTVVLQDKEALLRIAQTTDLYEPKCKIVAVEILSGLCFVPEEGHRQVLTALTDVSPLICQRTRFQKLIDDLHRRFSTDRETDRVRTAILGLFNALLRTGPAESCPQFRSHLRFELCMLGIQQVVDHIRDDASSRLEDHIDLFDMMRKEDEITLSGGSSEDSGSSSPVDFDSVVGMAEALHSKLRSSPALPHFVSLLQHLFMVPCDEQSSALWRLFDLILQQLSLQTTVQAMTDVHSPLINTIDMNDVLARLHTQCDYEQLERESERMKEELETERTRCMELENRLSDIQDGRGSISSRISDTSSSPSDPCPSPPPLPPVCPPVAPPPPPPIGGLILLGKTNAEATKKVPPPPGSLKSLNWTKIPESKVKGTVWEFIDDEKMYKQLDLNDIASNFPASSSHKDDDTDTIAGTISRRNKETQITVIDPRRYQNCAIMLSNLKLTHKEIRAAVLSMDDKGRLPKDMIEQMLKFVPTGEEMQQLNETVGRFKSPTVLALADRYLYEVAQIPRFEHRLRCLHIIRSFKDRVDCLIPAIQAVCKASTSVSTNKRFKQYLSLVLAIGNYLNHGKRNGNAYGFELSSLNCLTEVKSQRPDRNLLHYMVQLIERKFPDMTKMKRELAGVHEAARFHRAEVHAEIRSLEQAILAVRTELTLVESMKKEEMPEDIRENKDRFTVVGRQFINTATAEFNSLEKQFSEMKNKFSECANHFCYPPTIQPDELFTTLSKFLNLFSEYHQQLWLENEEQEKVKRQTLARSYFAKKTNRRKDKERDFEQLINALQSGDIFKEELNRLRTSFRVPKRSRTAKA